MDGESSSDTLSDSVSTNISEAEETGRWFKKLGYPNLCALSSIRFTHPGLSISELDEYVVKDDELGPALMHYTITQYLARHLEERYNQRIQREKINMYTQALVGEEDLRDLFTRQGPTWIFPKSHMMGVLPLGGDTLCLWDTGQPSTRRDYYVTPSGLLDQVSLYQKIGMVGVIKFNPD